MTDYRFPVATHTYFRLMNHDAEKQRFLADDSYVPVFAYSSQYDERLVSQRLQIVAGGLEESSLKLVAFSIQLQCAPTPENLERFRQCNEQVFGAPSVALLNVILARIRVLATPETRGYMDFITAQLGALPTEEDRIAPSRERFMRIKEYFASYCHPHVLDRHSSLNDALDGALQATGLRESGWSLRLLADRSHARVHHAKKRIVVGKQFQPRRQKSINRIIVHEVYGHAVRGSQPSLSESEGVALLFEQLLDTRFTYRRSYRYLAAALGWGVTRPAMTFRQVYEILWRVMVIMSKYSPADAQSHAFDECCRVFRGGLPGVAGAVYLKDSVYFRANIEVWQNLVRQDVGYNGFIDIIEGRRKVLG